jgi:lycopene cyclase domain-containing protein
MAMGEYWTMLGLPSNLAYVGVLVFVLVGSLWLEVALRTHVFARLPRLLLVLAVVIWPFLLWDAYAIGQGHWFFDTDRITGIYLPGDIPLDELLFFLTIPIASILTLEAVRSVRGWPVGDGSDEDLAKVSQS